MLPLWKLEYRRYFVTVFQVGFEVFVKFFIFLRAENTAVACVKHFPDIDDPLFVTRCYLVLIGQTLDRRRKCQAISRTLVRLVGWLHCIPCKYTVVIRSLTQRFSRFHETYFDLVRRQYLP